MKSTPLPAFGTTLAIMAMATVESSPVLAGTLKPDAQMQPVLDKLATLGGKPIETLTAAEARKQPSPADAVMALLKEQGQGAPEKTGKVEDSKADNRASSKTTVIKNNKVLNTTSAF